MLPPNPRSTGWRTTRSPSRSAMATVSSLLALSTRTISSTYPGGMARTVSSRVRALFRAGMMTTTRDPPAETWPIGTEALIIHPIVHIARRPPAVVLVQAVAAAATFVIFASLAVRHVGGSVFLVDQADQL